MFLSANPAEASCEKSPSVELSVEIPVDIQLQNISGNFRLSWPIVSNLPGEVEITLIDTHTGQSCDLGHKGYVDFTMQASGKGGAVRSVVFQKPDIRPMELKNGSQRFMIIVNSVVKSTEPVHDLPTVFGLDQNYQFLPLTTRVVLLNPLAKECEGVLIR